METTTLTITEFLLERIAYDERYLNGWADLDRADTNRLAAEIEAKRRIVEIHAPEDAPAFYPDKPHGTEQICGNCGGILGEPACLTLRALASIYADHPDYREEWLA